MTFTRLSIAAGAFAALALSGCVSMPEGPSVMALPGTGRSFDQFRADDMDCRQYARSQIGGTAEQAQENSAIKSAAVGTAIGAAAGALLGGHQGAGSGAAAGLIVGSAAGAGAGNSSGYSLQHRYDIAYTQCMYAKGDQVPMSGYAPRRAAPTYYAPPPPPPPNAPAPAASSVPPPPPGTPPPPPPGTH